jgi:hypothetical protein
LSEHDPDFKRSAGDEPPAAVSDTPSLGDDVAALIDDGKTYLEAELQFQKSRASFVLDRSRSGAIYGVAAVILLHLALIAFVVGAVLALAPTIGPWGATLLVVGVLLVAGALLGLSARRRFSQLSTAFTETGK